MHTHAHTQLGDAISLLADGNGELTKALDLELDLRKAVLGVRSKRCVACVRAHVECLWIRLPVLNVLNRICGRASLSLYI